MTSYAVYATISTPSIFMDEDYFVLFEEFLGVFSGNQGRGSEPRERSEHHEKNDRRTN